jgi:DeoR family deoxyribose operon repressor
MGQKEDRQEREIEVIRNSAAITIRELAQRLAVSEMTVRRDLRELEKAGTVTMMHAGGAVLNRETPTDRHYSLVDENAVHWEEKQRIGSRAAELIGPGDSVIVDSGSTTEWLARAIRGDLEFRALCFALNIFVELSSRSSCHVVFGGGDLHRETMVCEGPGAYQAVSRFRANTGFFSARGVHPEMGVTCSSSYEVELKRSSMESCLKKILLVDASKLGTVGAAHYGEVEEFDVVITDSRAPAALIGQLRERGLEIVTA